MQVPQHHLDPLLNSTALSLPGLGYAALVAVVDEAVCNITKALQEEGMWENTLFVFQVGQ
jgi:hypothetical protein